MDSTDLGLLWFFWVGAGLAWVVSQYWPRFNIPTRTSKLEHFKKYAPRFATRQRQYAQARYCYVGLVAGLYIALSLSPQIAAEFLGKLDKQVAPALVSLLQIDNGSNNIVFPLLVAVLFTNINKIPGLKRIEFQIRSFFHTLGQIPEGVQATVGQLKSSTFDFSTCPEFANGPPVGTGEIPCTSAFSQETLLSDDVMRTWCMVYCLTDRLRPVGAHELPIHAEFLDAYHDEMVEIAKEREEAQERVAAYAGYMATGQENLVDMGPEGHDLRTDARERVRNLRDRLFVYLACGFRSSAATEGEVISGLRALGFEIRVQRPAEPVVMTLIGAVLIYLIIMTPVAAWLAKEFHEAMATLDYPKYASALLVPTPKPAAIPWLWTLTSGMFTLAAVAAAFAIRQARLNRNAWFRLDAPARGRPVLTRYPWTAILAGLTGMAALFCVNFAMGLAFGPSPAGVPFEAMLMNALSGTYPWFPLAVIVSLAGLYIIDGDYLQLNFGGSIARMVACSSVVGLVGGLIAYISAYSRYNSFVRDTTADGANAGGPEMAGQSEALLAIEGALPYAALLIGLLILIQTLYVTFILLHMECSAQRSGELVERWLNLRNSAGEEQEFFLAKDGEVLAVNIESGMHEPFGHWIHYPECLVLHWSRPLQYGKLEFSGTGVLHRESGVIVYSKLSDQGAVNEFVAQGSVSEGSRPVKQMTSPQLKVVGV